MYGYPNVVVPHVSIMKRSHLRAHMNATNNEIIHESMAPKYLSNTKPEHATGGARRGGAQRGAGGARRVEVGRGRAGWDGGG